MPAWHAVPVQAATPPSNTACHTHTHLVTPLTVPITLTPPHLGHRLLAVLLEALEAIHSQRLATRHAHAALDGAVLSLLLRRLHSRLALVRPDCRRVGWVGVERRGCRGEWARGWAQSRGGWRPRTQLMPAWGQHCPARLPPVPKHSPSPWVTLTVRVPSSLRPSVSGMGAGAAACSGWEELVWRVTRRAGGTQAPSGGAQPPHRTPAPCLQAPKPPPSCSLSAHPEQAAGSGLGQRGGGKGHRAGAGGHRQGRGSAASRQVTSGVAGHLHLLLRQFCMGARDGAKSRCGGLSKGGQRGGTGLTHHESTQVGCSISDPPTRQPYPSQP